MVLQAMRGKDARALHDKAASPTAWQCVFNPQLIDSESLSGVGAKTFSMDSSMPSGGPGTLRHCSSAVLLSQGNMPAMPVGVALAWG